MAEPISAAIAAFAFSAGASIATATVVGAVAANVIIAAGTQLAINALTPKAKVTATASQLQTKIGAVTPRAIIMGRTAVAGTLLTPTPLKSGKDDRFASNFYALSHAGPSGVVESIQWGDDVVTFDGNGNAIGKYNDNMWLFQKNGDWSQTAISYVGHAVLGSSTPSAWDNTKTGKGCLMVALVVRYAAKVLGGNMQTPLFVVDANAAVLIDPRTGLAATTQAQRRNPAVWAYSWRLGWFQNSKRVIGMGQASSEIHTAAYAYAANVADTNSWTIGGEATTADDRYAVETIILQTCASVPVERNGLQSVVTSAVRSSVGTITSDDLRADPKWRYNTQQSSRPTAIQTRFRSESNRWQMVEGAEVTDAGWLTADAGREKRVTVEYPYAAGGSAHVGHLAALEASNAREPLIFTLQCKQQARYDGFVGDAVTVSLPEIGLSSTKMIITSRVVNPDGTVDFDLLVETDAKYDFAAGKTSTAPSFTLQPGFDINSVPQPGASEWAAVAAQITSGTTTLPIVRVTGSAADYSFASGVVFRLRLNSGGSPWLVAEDAPPASTQHEFRGLTNATGYIVGVAYRGVTGVEGPIRELAAVTTGALEVETGAATTVPWSGVTGAGKPEDNATIGARVGTNIFPGSGSTPLPATQLLNDQIGIDANGRLTNTGTGSAVVGNAQITIDANGRLTNTGTGTTIVDNFQIGLDANGRLTTTNTGSAIVDNGKITIDANGRLTTTGTGSVVVDNSKITLGTLGFTGATDATRNVVSTGLLSARPTGADGDLFFATDDNNGAGLLYTKIAGAWVADPKAKVLFDSLTTTVNANEATNSSFRSSQTTNNSAQAASLTTLEAQMANTAGSGLQSRISTEESARASADTALASRATTLEAQVANTAGSGLQSRISTEESARASADTALATRATNLEATVNDGTTGVSATAARLTTEESTRASADSALATRATNLESTVNNGTTGVAATAARLTTEEGTRATADTALAGRATTLEATVNNATTGVAATAARLTTEEGARASADTALAARATTLEATVNDGTTGLVATRARLVTEEGTRATADTALATRSTTLESVVRFPVPEALNKNPTFATWSGASGTLPEDWLDWSNGYTNTKATGDLSPFAYRQSNPAGAVNYGIYHLLNGRMTQGNYVLEADVTLNSGVFNGAALYCQWGVSSITVDERIEFTTALDVSGSAPGAGVVGRRYRFSKMINVSNTAELFGLYIMTNADGFASSGNAKDLTWHKALIRPATQGEIDAKVAKDTTIPTTIARIATEETTRASADSALAARSTTLESQIANTSASGLQSRIATEESTRASADSTQASQITTLTAQANGNPNLFPYPTPITNRTPTQLGWTGTPISSIFAAFVGGLVYYKARGSGGSAVNEAYIYDLPEEFYFQTSSSYTLSCYGYAGTGAVNDRVYAYLEFRSADNSTLLHTSTSVTLNSISTRQSLTGTFPGTSTAGKLRVVFLREWPSSGAYQDVVFNMIKVEAGTVATAFTNSAQVIVQSNAIATLNDSAAFYQILVAASGGDPAIVRLFSGLGGSEVSIAAKIISLINTSSGVSMPVMRATGGEAFFQRPISSDFGSRRVTIGPGYGVSGSEVVLWFGPSSIAPASQSRANSIFALGTDGQVYYGGTGLEVGSMQMTLSSYDVNLTRSGSGATSQSMTATGYAPGTITYLWELLSGDAVNIGSATAATTNIGHSLSLGETKTSVVKCTATSSTGPTTFRLLSISSSEIS